MKHKLDWIAIGASVGIVFLIRLMLTSDSFIFPAFIAALALQFVVWRSARHS